MSKSTVARSPFVGKASSLVSGSDRNGEGKFWHGKDAARCSGWVEGGVDSLTCIHHEAAA